MFVHYRCQFEFWFSFAARAQAPY